MWAEAELKEKAEIARVADEAKENTGSEAKERGKAWAEARVKRKVEISSLAV